MDIRLPAGLAFRVAQTNEELERIAELHAQVFEPAAALATRALATSYPGMRPQDWVYVQDTDTGETVSSICLVPTVWTYEGLPLRVAELGIVATHADYRRRGLIRAQMRWFEAQLHERKFDLASIQGIPFFYRQFGFEFILPLGRVYELTAEQVPDALEADSPDAATVRRAADADLPRLQQMLAETAATLEVCMQRSDGAWSYQEDPARDDFEALDTYIVQGPEGILGYFRLFRRETRDHPGVIVVEASALSYAGCMAVLRFAKGIAVGCQHAHTIRLSVPPSSDLARTAAYLNARCVQPYGWQVRIPEPGRFLRHIAPALERRLAHSYLAGYNSFLRFDLYTDTLELTFKSGRLSNVHSLGRLESRAVRFPWWAAWQLWLGHRSRAELCAWYPDAHVDSALQPLVDVLWPKRESWVFPTI